MLPPDCRLVRLEKPSARSRAASPRCLVLAALWSAVPWSAVPWSAVLWFAGLWPAVLGCSRATSIEEHAPAATRDRDSEATDGGGEPSGPDGVDVDDDPATVADRGQASVPSAAPPDSAEVEGPSSPGAAQPAAPTQSQPPTGTTPVTPALPTITCDGQLPASFVTLCSSCHTHVGAPNERYPDLYSFTGSIDEFKRRVRGGATGMAAYDERVVADADLEAIYEYFTSGQSQRGASAPDLGDLQPLFDQASAVHPAVVFQREDGVLITRGAGRVRQRHELEGSFNPYGAHYFEDRSFGILIEDYTTAGESLIRVAYLPVGEPTDGTNFRAWKIYGDGNVFHANMGMDSSELPELLTSQGSLDLATNYSERIAPFTRVQSQQVTSNWRTGDPIAAGDVFDFEFGVFLEEGAVRAGSRTSYYSDTYRYQVGVGGFSANNPDSSGLPGPSPAAQLGGDGTNVWLYEDPEFAFEQMALNVQHENVQPFLRGRRLFHTDFETGAHFESGNPVFEEHSGKLGPLFVAHSCESCHPHNGPGRLLERFDEHASTAFKLYDAPELGRQLQLQEGEVSTATVSGPSVTLADGTAVQLSRPEFTVEAEGEPLRHSARLARKLIGLGLLEAIDEATLLGRADPSDCDGDGISGRALFVAEPSSGALMLGRFGWKAEKISVRHQVLDALEGDLGVGSAELPDSAGNVEIDAAAIADLTSYMSLLSVPGQRDADDPRVQRGDELFKTVGCAQCHVSDVVTGTNHPFAELRGQAIKPYTDLLLHDMGEALADDSGVASSDDPRAVPAASEWRTPPLWGIGLYATVNGNTGLLHDGRAANVLEAILWHGGEAEGAKQRFAELDADSREALIAFVESL